MFDGAEVFLACLGLFFAAGREKTKKDEQASSAIKNERFTQKTKNMDDGGIGSLSLQALGIHVSTSCLACGFLNVWDYDYSVCHLTMCSSYFNPTIQNTNQL